MRTPVIALVACALAAAGCGDDDSDDNGGGGNGGGGASSPYGGGRSNDDDAAQGAKATKLELSADPGGALRFDKTSLQAKPGQVTIAFDNPSQVPHAVEVEGNGVEEETETLTDGEAKLTIDLEAGEYRFYCPVGNHAQAGMEGTLTVG